jgi:hypothetical protein
MRSSMGLSPARCARLPRRNAGILQTLARWTMRFGASSVAIVTGVSVCRLQAMRRAGEGHGRAGSGPAGSGSRDQPTRVQVLRCGRGFTPGHGLRSRRGRRAGRPPCRVGSSLRGRSRVAPTPRTHPVSPQRSRASTSCPGGYRSCRRSRASPLVSSARIRGGGPQRPASSRRRRPPSPPPSFALAERGPRSFVGVRAVGLTVQWARQAGAYKRRT